MARTDRRALMQARVAQRFGVGDWHKEYDLLKRSGWSNLEIAGYFGIAAITLSRWLSERKAKP